MPVTASWTAASSPTAGTRVSTSLTFSFMTFSPFMTLSPFRQRCPELVLGLLPSLEKRSRRRFGFDFLADGILFMPVAVKNSAGRNESYPAVLKGDESQRSNGDEPPLDASLPPRIAMKLVNGP